MPPSLIKLAFAFFPVTFLKILTFVTLSIPPFETLIVPSACLSKILALFKVNVPPFTLIAPLTIKPPLVFRFQIKFEF